MVAVLLIPTPNQAIAQPEIAQPTPRLAPGILLQFANLQFVEPTTQPDFDEAVLKPLRKAQADKAAAEKAESDRLEKLLNDCKARGGHLSGEQCVIPVVAPKVAVATSYSVQAGPTSYGNNYTRGQCTWYVANRISVPSSMGNAGAWGYGLSAAGWLPVLAPGSVGVGAGHVVYVESVGLDGVHISDMNYAGTFVVTYRTVSVGSYAWFHR